MLLPKVLRYCDVVVTLNDGFRLLVPSLREPVAFHCLIDGVYEPEVSVLLKQFLTSGGTFLDIGSNVGVFTLMAARIVGESGLVIAVEASPEINRYLKHNIAEAKHKNIRHVEKAVADTGPRPISFWQAPFNKFGMGALAPQFGTEAITVEADTIDHILASIGVDHINLVKIDIEGFEAMAFRGAEKLLSRQPRPIIIFEFVDWAESRAGARCGEAQRLLVDLDYSLHLIARCGHLRKLERPLEADAGNIVAIPNSA